jgi:hypothetical protein
MCVAPTIPILRSSNRRPIQLRQGAMFDVTDLNLRYRTHDGCTEHAGRRLVRAEPEAACQGLRPRLAGVLRSVAAWLAPRETERAGLWETVTV